MRIIVFLPALLLLSSNALGLTQYSCELSMDDGEKKRVMLQYDEATSVSSVVNEFGQAFDADLISFYEINGTQASTKFKAVAIRMRQLTVFVEVSLSDNGSVYSVNHSSENAQNVHLVSMYPSPVESESDEMYLLSGFGNCDAL
jgi:DUF438 domain-containing protein